LSLAAVIRGLSILTYSRLSVYLPYRANQGKNTVSAQRISGRARGISSSGPA
jgi:hypothetical protein